MAKSAGEWSEDSWNPATGCTKVSPGCKNCYAERIAKHLQRQGNPRYKNSFELTLHENAMEKPLKWKKPKRIFVNSMSDLFHDEIPEDFIQRVFAVIRRAPWHEFLILTKRSERLAEMDPRIDWPDNVWMGVSVENQDYVNRIDHLRNTKAKNKFLSLEPLLGPLPNLNLSGIDWVTVGGETGPHFRPPQPEWIADIRDQSIQANIPFFFKHWSGPHQKTAERLLQGRTWDEMPQRLRLK